MFDIGCGAGGTLVPFREAGWHVYGCDLGSEYLDRGREVGLNLLHGDAHVLEPLGKADVIILSHILEHMPDPLESVVQMRKLLKPSGYLYVEVPGIFAVHLVYGDFMLFVQNAHLYHFTLTTLRSLLARAGYQLVDGNERIVSLFRKRTAEQEVSTQDQYKKIRAYLLAVEAARSIGLLAVYRASRRWGGQLGRVVLGERAFRSLKSFGKERR